MKHAQLLDQLQCFTPESLGDMFGGRLAGLGPGELGRDFAFTESVVLKPLGGFLPVHSRSENVVEAELTRKYIHQDVDGTLIIAACFLRWRPFVGQSVQNVYLPV